MDMKHISKISTPSPPPSKFSSSNPPSDSKERKTRNWLDLPRDVTSMILMKLGAFKILNSAQQVCTLWRSICKEPHMWRTIDMRNLGIRKNVDYNLRKMCRHAIDRSCGQLVEINVEYFGDNYLLKYIADSTCHHLRCLRLVQCYFEIDEGLIEVAKKLTWLEELEITLCPVSYVALEAIGRCCPLLKSLKFHQEGFSEYNREAFAIAQTMPELRHLRLFRNNLSNSGLLAILDGCPCLESLDIRRCSGVNLGGSLGKRCAEQIKDLRHPGAPIDDYRFGAALDYFTMYDDDTLDYIFEVRDKHQAVPFNESVNRAHIENEKIAEKGELSESSGVGYEETEWEEIDAIWAIAKNQRSGKGKKNTNSTGFRRSHIGKKNANSKGKKHGRKAGKINHKSICFEEELW